MFTSCMRQSTGSHSQSHSYHSHTTQAVVVGLCETETEHEAALLESMLEEAHAASKRLDSERMSFFTPASWI